MIIPSPLASSVSDITINWSALSLPAWRELFLNCSRTPLTQSYDYASAIAATSAYRPRWGIIENQGHPVGLVQVLTIPIGARLTPVVALERGPVWMTPPTIHQIKGFFRAFDQQFPRSWFRIRRILPECAAALVPPDVFQTLGYRARPSLIPYQTMWLDAPSSPDRTRTRLDKKWRNLLAKAEHHPQIEIRHTTTFAGAIPLIQAVLADQAARGYRGPDTKLIMALAKAHAAGDGLLATTAYIDDQLMAGALFLRHGRCATWQAGVVLPPARDTCANYRVVFEGIATLFKMGVASVDLGGYNTVEADGIRHFKTGLGGQHVELVGAFG